jgi:hypothetical protein
MPMMPVARFRSTWGVLIVAAAFVVLFQGVASACDERIYGSCEARAFQRHRPDGWRHDARRPAEPKRAPRQKPPDPPTVVATDEPRVTGGTVPVVVRQPAKQPAAASAASAFVRPASSAGPTTAGTSDPFAPAPRRTATDTGSSIGTLPIILFMFAGLISLMLGMMGDGLARPTVSRNW